MRLQFDTLDDIQRWAINEALLRGDIAAPRGLATRELLCPTLTLSNPRSRCISTSARKWSLPLAVGEFCWHVSASDKLDSLAYYAKRWREFSDDNRTIQGSCYGKRVFGESATISQWQRAIQLLRTDSSTRRAVLDLQGIENALSPQAKDVACATTLQFLVRSERLHAILYMRSNDILFGLPYDIFLFTMLQELMACNLGLELGDYHHVVGSLHLYEKDVFRAKAVLEAPKTSSFEMPRMNSVDQLPIFLAAEKQIRIGEIREITAQLSGYWVDLLDVLLLFRARGHLLPGDLKPRLTQSPYRTILQPYFERELA